MTWLIQSDGEVELFEFVLQKIVQRNLDDSNLAMRVSGRRPILHAQTARAGLRGGFCPRSQMSAAMTRAKSKKRLIRARRMCGRRMIRNYCCCNRANAAAWTRSARHGRLALAVPIIKKNLLEACAHVVGADGVIGESEAELLRAVADTFRLPNAAARRGGMIFVVAFVAP